MNEIKYKTYGDKSKPALVLVNAFPFDQHMWNGQVKSLSEKLFVICYDHRGFGDSPLSERPFFLEDLASDLLSLVKKLDLKEVFVCGLSLGGYVVLRALEKDENLFKGVILASTKFAADDNGAKLNRAKGVADIEKEGLKKYQSAFLDKCLSHLPEDEKKSAVEKLLKTVEGNKPQAVQQMLVAMATRTDTEALLSKSRIPKLIMYGDEDVIIPPTEAKKMMELSSNASLKNFKGCGHLINFEAGPEFNQNILYFVESTK